MESTKYIAHRGFMSKKTENTIEAFEFAARSNVFGIETDVHVTRDGKFVCFHDDNTLRLCGEEYIVEDVDFQTLSDLEINGKHKIPRLDEFIEICKAGKKAAFIELKNPFLKKDIDLLVREVGDLGYLDNAIFISFDLQNVLALRGFLPRQEIQLVTDTYDEKKLKMLARKKIDLDIEYTCLSRERIKHCKSLGLRVNCWTLDDEKTAKSFEECGIDYITTNYSEKVK